MSELVQIGKFNFRFQCQPGCTACCTQSGDVYLTDDDVDRIARYLKLTPEEFRTRHCETDDGDLRLAGPSEKPCQFVEEGGCSIYEVRPLQCRTFPFWPENVRSKRAWKNLCPHCPGIGVGPVLDVAEVRKQAQVCQDGFPDL